MGLGLNLAQVFRNLAKPGAKFTVPGPPPQTIPDGYVLLRRISRSNFLQVHYPNGSYENFVHSRGTHAYLVKRGVNPYKVEWIVDYLYNFEKVLVRVREPGTWTEDDQ